MHVFRFSNLIIGCFIVSYIIVIYTYIYYYDDIDLWISSIQIISLKDYQLLIKEQSSKESIKEIINYIKIARNHLPLIKGIEELVIYNTLTSEVTASDILTNNNKIQFLYKNKINPSVLCSTFINLSWKSIDLIVKNMHNTDIKCTWLFIVYAYNKSEHVELMNYFESLIADIPDTVDFNYEFKFASGRKQLLSEYLAICTDIHYQHNNILKSLSNNNSMMINPHCQSIKHIYQSFSSIPIPYNGRIYPKIMLFILLLPYLTSSKYQYVWILDGDLSVETFQYQKFLNIHQCIASDNNIFPPLVAQPLIEGNTQTYPYLNSIHWINTTNSATKILAVESGFIEIQAPFIQTSFLHWYIINFIIPTIIPTHILGADWGFDALFCNAAKVYQYLTFTLHHHHHHHHHNDSNNSNNLHHRLNNNLDETNNPCTKLRILIEHNQQDSTIAANQYTSLISKLSNACLTYITSTDTYNKHNNTLSFTNTNIASACSIIIDGTPIIHENSKETNNILGYTTKKILNKELMNILSNIFPNYIKLGQNSIVNPLMNKSLKRFYKLNNNCKI